MYERRAHLYPEITTLNTEIEANKTWNIHISVYTWIALIILKRHNQAKIIKRSVFLFWLPNMTMWCKHVHRLKLQFQFWILVIFKVEASSLKVIYHPLYGMNKYVLIWSDWLSCDQNFRIAHLPVTRDIKTKFLYYFLFFYMHVRNKKSKISFFR